MAVLDRRTGELLSADPYFPLTWASHVDMKSGRPVENPEARYGEIPVLLSPHPGGGHNFNPMSYSPLTRLVYFPVVQTFGMYAAATSYTPGNGTGVNYGGHADIRKKLSEYGTNAGWGGGLAHVELASGKGLHVSSARLLVFKLGGSAELPPLPDAPSLSPPPRIPTTDAELTRGEQLYAQHCVMCHGPQARGGLKDLRYMTSATRAEFYDIVLGGKRVDKGMIAFADRLNREDAKAINAYLTIRALEEWGEPH